MPCTSLTWWRNVDVTEIMPFSVHVTVTNHHATERDAIFYPSRDVATQFARFKSGGLQHLGYPSREGLPFANRWCEGVERTSAEGVEGWRLLDHIIITTAIAQWRSRLNARFRVNGGHFQHKFWASDFLLCFACFIDTSSPKCDRYKHVQSANYCVKCFAFVSETFTRYSSNITNVWQEILTSVTSAFSCEVVHEKLRKSINICKSYSKKISPVRGLTVDF